MLVNKIKKYISSFFIEPTVISPFSKDLSSYVVVITGGSRGIGKAIIEVLARGGAQVIVLSRTATTNTDTTHSMAVDITDAQQVDTAMKNILQTYRKIDVLINNAGVFLDKNLEDVSEQEFTQMMDTNVKGMFLTAKAVIPHMKKRKQGLIINIGSKISHNTNVAPKKVLYATSKYAVEGFSLALSKELKSFGIRVTCLMPGTVNTFVSLKSKEYMSPFSLGFLVEMLIKSNELDFESIVFKSRSQNL
jgi:NAD(P)-dependent dehydrogenase (short-subunit alcohol dehydrogenase family)